MCVYVCGCNAWNGLVRDSAVSYDGLVCYGAVRYSTVCKYVCRHVRMHVNQNMDVLHLHPSLSVCLPEALPCGDSLVPEVSISTGAMIKWWRHTSMISWIFPRLRSSPKVSQGRASSFLCCFRRLASDSTDCHSSLPQLYRFIFDSSKSERTLTSSKLHCFYHHFPHEKVNILNNKFLDTIKWVCLKKGTVPHSIP